MRRSTIARSDGAARTLFDLETGLRREPLHHLQDRELVVDDEERRTGDGGGSHRFG
jgi:hypothetical protein